jgi:protein TonB
MKANSSTDRFNELVFEDRNKEYGAYLLRQSQGEHITRSILFSTTIFTFLIIFSVYLTNRDKALPDLEGQLPWDPGILIQIDPPVTPPVQPKVKSAAAPRSQSGAYKASDDVLKKDENPDPSLPISKNPNPLGPIADSSDIKEPVIIAPPVAPVVERIPDKMPELASLYPTILSNLKYPEIAKDNRTEGTVYVSFIVETDGSVSNVEVLKRVGDGCTEEAVRVVNLLKGWTPGIKNGKAVRVPCTLPIKFTLK